MIWKALFGVVGFGSLVSILHHYGFSKLADDLTHLGWWVIPLALSFLPVAFCYSMAWQLTVPELPFSRTGTFFRFSIVSIAWNNLSPFVKVMGEAMRVTLLQKWVSRKAAIRSVVLYNLVHILGTLAAFLLGSAIILFHFPVDHAVRIGFVSLIVITAVLFLVAYFLPQYRGQTRKTRGAKGFLWKLGFWTRWALSKIRLFSKKHPGRFWTAVFLETIARFVEGLTFYVAFWALGDHLPAFYCALLDVGRALMDNVFFFIPYQVGSREAGLLLLSNQVIRMGATTAVSAAVLYRLVEIFWMLAGYGLWMYETKSYKSSK